MVLEGVPTPLHQRQHLTNPLGERLTSFNKKSADVAVRAHSLAIPRFLQTQLRKAYREFCAEGKSLDFTGICEMLKTVSCILQ
jgi:hypothetical protein